MDSKQVGRSKNKNIRAKKQKHLLLSKTFIFKKGQKYSNNKYVLNLLQKSLRLYIYITFPFNLFIRKNILHAYLFFFYNEAFWVKCAISSHENDETSPDYLLTMRIGTLCT